MSCASPRSLSDVAVFFVPVSSRTNAAAVSEREKPASRDCFVRMSLTVRPWTTQAAFVDSTDCRTVPSAVSSVWAAETTDLIVSSIPLKAMIPPTTFPTVPRADLIPPCVSPAKPEMSGRIRTNALPISPAMSSPPSA